MPERHVGQWFRLANKVGEEDPSLPAPPEGMDVVRFERQSVSCKPLNKPTTMRYTTPMQLDAMKTPYIREVCLDKEGYATAIKLMDFVEWHEFWETADSKSRKEDNVLD